MFWSPILYCETHAASNTSSIKEQWKGNKKLTRPCWLAQTTASSIKPWSIITLLQSLRLLRVIRSLRLNVRKCMSLALLNIVFWVSAPQIMQPFGCSSVLVLGEGFGELHLAPRAHLPNFEIAFRVQSNFQCWLWTCCAPSRQWWQPEVRDKIQKAMISSQKHWKRWYFH